MHDCECTPRGRRDLPHRACSDTVELCWRHGQRKKVRALARTHPAGDRDGRTCSWCCQQKALARPKTTMHLLHSGQTLTYKKQRRENEVGGF